MKIQDILKEAYIVILANKVRSSLTVLGIVIGISSIISIISIGQGASKQIQLSIEGLGSNILTIVPGFVQPGRGVISAGRGSAQTLKNEDVDVLKKIPGIIYISPEVNKRFQIAASNKNTNSLVIGVEPDYFQVRNIKISNGSFITEKNLRSLEKVAVLGPVVAYDLFGEDNPVGKNIRINGINFKIIGLLQSKGTSGFFNLDDLVLIPLTTMQKIVAGVDFLSLIAISVENKDLMFQIQEDITFALAKKHRVDPKSPDFSIVSQANILETFNKVTNTFTIFLTAIASISLIVGGIGIMNMMLTTVTERTREIGLRKAIGARKKDISLQFLIEAVMITFFGGVIGVLFGFIIVFGVSQFSDIETKVSLKSILLAFGMSTAIGIIFGYYPAKKAASLNPIEALRYE